MKLTRPQRALLNEIAEYGPVAVSVNSAPANKLVTDGLAAWRFAKLNVGVIELTPAGRLALQEKNDG